MEDPTTSESYVALRNALIAIQDDPSALQSILSSVSDGGASWVKTAYWELRRSLLLGRLKGAETVGNLIGLILESRDPDVNDELSESRLHREGMRALEDGIGAVLAQDNLTGISHLEQLTEAVYAPESLRWVAWYWLTRAASDEGNLSKALKAIQEAMRLAKGLDEHARANTLCRLSDVEFLRGEYDGALEHASEASSIFEEIGDRRGMAMAFLSRGRMLTMLSRDDEGLESARRAQEADADWEDPVVFLSQRALANGDVLGAGEVIEPFLSLEPQSPEVERQARLVADILDDQVPRAVAVDYLNLRSQPVSQESVEALEVLWLEHKDFVQLRETLAWSLVKVGREEDAAKHFKAMAGMKLEPAIQSSVMLGLGCLANREFKHRQPGARVRAAASAYDDAASDDGDIDNSGETEFDDPSTTTEVRDVQEALDASFDFDPAAVADDAMDQLDAAMVVETDLTPPPPSPLSQLQASVPPLTPPPTPKDAKPAAPKAKAVFTGSLQLFAVPDLLDFLGTSRRTGTLVITSEHGIGAVHMKNGFIAGAAAPNSINMGDLLMEKKQVTQQQLQSAVERQKTEGSKRLLGAILLEMELVDRAALTEALDKQARGALREMVEWTNGRFAFEPDKNGEELPGEIELNLDTRGVLLDVLREFDEDNK